MGIKGRKRRLRNFQQRAKDFAAGCRKRTGYKTLELDGKPLSVGAGKHRRLVGKFSDNDMLEGQRRQEMLQSYLRGHKIVPQNYELVQPASALIGAEAKKIISLPFGVQEFFHRPNLLVLRAFFWGKQVRAGRLRALSKEEFLLCKQLVNQYKAVTAQKVEAAAQEIEARFSGAGTYVAMQNLVVVGITRQGRLRLAIVDV